MRKCICCEQEKEEENSLVFIYKGKKLDICLDCHGDWIVYWDKIYSKTFDDHFEEFHFKHKDKVS